MCAVPTAAPSVSVSALSSMVLRVAWNPPTTTTWMGTIQELHLEYGLVVYNETEDAMEQTLTIAISPLAQPDDIAGSMNITGLMPFAEYYVQMSLMNNAGEGPYSEATSAMTLQDCELHVLHVFCWSCAKVCAIHCLCLRSAVCCQGPISTCKLHQRHSHLVHTKEC